MVLPGAAFARPAEVASGYVGSLTLGAGQFCTNPGLLFVPEDVGLLSAIGEAVGASAGGPMLSGRIFAGYEDAVAEAEDHPGVTELAAGQPGAGTVGGHAAGVPAHAEGVRRRPRGAVPRAVRPGRAGHHLSVGRRPAPGARRAGRESGWHRTRRPGSAEDLDLARQVVTVLEHVAGRIVFNGWPTGVAVVAAQHHGGPWPATTVPAYTSVGTAAIRRWLVPVAYQNFPPELLPPGLR